MNSGERAFGKKQIRRALGWKYLRHSKRPSYEDRERPAGRYDPHFDTRGAMRRGLRRSEAFHLAAPNSPSAMRMFRRLSTEGEIVLDREVGALFLR